MNEVSISRFPDEVGTKGSYNKINKGYKGRQKIKEIYEHYYRD